jgi:DNA polymerase
VQVQNLPQNHLDDIDAARQMVVGGDLDEMLLAYDNPMQVLSELIRTAFVASPGHTFHVCDFSAIEARVIAWLAGEQWVLDVFRQGGDIYCATASKMFGVPVEKHGRNAHLRQRGKVAVLALGYGGGVSALEAMGGSRLGLTEEEMRSTVRQWRGANPRIVRLWERVQNAAVNAILNENRQPINRGIVMECHGGMLTVKLPSGRYLCYPEASLRRRTGRPTSATWA